MSNQSTLCRLTTIVFAIAMIASIGCQPNAGGTPGTTAGDAAVQPEPLMSADSVKLLAELPDKWNTPDGMCLLPNGEVLVAVPNVNNDKFDPPADYPATILKITPDNEIEEFGLTPPLHPTTGKFYPFGMCIDAEGKNLFIADLQWFANPDAPGNNSRVLRVPIDENGDPAGEPVVALDGMVVANAVVVRDGYLYVSDTTMVPDSKPLLTGVFRIKLDPEEGTTLTLPLIDDPHLIATIETHNPDVGFGADGLTFDGKGNLYIGNFGDGTLHIVKFDEDGNPKVDPTTDRAPIFAQAPFMKSCDGIFYDAKADKIYVADSIANAVQIVSPEDGSVVTLVVDVENDGTGGRLDQPCEVVIRGNEMIISNFDMPVPGGVNQTFNAPHTISILQMEE